MSDGTSSFSNWMEYVCSSRFLPPTILLPFFTTHVSFLNNTLWSASHKLNTENELYVISGTWKWLFNCTVRSSLEMFTSDSPWLVAVTTPVPAIWTRMFGSTPTFVFIDLSFNMRTVAPESTNPVWLCLPFRLPLAVFGIIPSLGLWLLSPCSCLFIAVGANRTTFVTIPTH